jgi:hypothetical protein
MEYSDRTVSSERCFVHSNLPTFSPTRIVAYNMHVGSLNNVHFDMVIENDLVERLQINFEYTTSTLEWEGLETPMRSRDAILEDI